MKVITNDTKELIIKIEGIVKKVNVKIINQNRKEGLVYISVLDSEFMNLLSSKQEVEVQIHKSNASYSFKSKIKQVHKISNEISVISPIKINKSKRNTSQALPFETVVKIAGANHQNFFAQSCDISKKGISFNSRNFFYTGDILFISFESAAERKRYNLEVTIKSLYVGEDGVIKYETEFAEWFSDELDNLLKYLEQKEINKKIRVKKLAEQPKAPKKTFFQKLLAM